MTFKLTRRAALAGVAALPLAIAGTTRLSAQGAVASVGLPLARGFTLGGFTVTTLLDASFPGNGAKKIFGANALDDEWARISSENFIPAEKLQLFFTPTLVDTGARKILFDTGLGRGGLVPALAAAGVAPGEIDTVVLTHMHPDHIGGVISDGAPTFPNATYVTGRVEYDGWMQSGTNGVTKLMATNVTPLAERTQFIEDGTTIAPGITAMAAFGHTPGHMAYMLESDGRSLMLTVDTANHYVWPFANPDWHLSFDVDKPAASASRRRVLGMLAADRVPMIGYHMPFPAAGFVEPRGDGFRFVPVGYQLMG